MKLIITLTDSEYQLAKDAFSTIYKTNGLSAEDFLNKQLVEFIENVVYEYQRQATVKTAEDTLALNKVILPTNKVTLG